jgi:hypothetical protein
MKIKLNTNWIIAALIAIFFFAQKVQASTQFPVSLVKTLNSTFLWHLVYLNGTMHSDSYNASSSVNQKYYAAIAEKKLTVKKENGETEEIGIHGFTPVMIEGLDNQLQAGQMADVKVNDSVSIQYDKNDQSAKIIAIMQFLTL